MSARGKLYILSVLLVAASVTSVYKAPTVHAAQITTRSLTLLANGAVGGSTPNGVVNHKFDFTLPSNVSVGSIKFEYCTIATQEACVAPTDLNASTATFGGEAGATGFSIASATTNVVTIARASATAATGVVSYTLNSVHNPSPANYTFFVRISTFGSLDGTGTAIDTGTVAASTANPIQLTGIMPESLIFCTGATIDLTVNGDPNCSTATGGIITFNQLFSPTDTATATSQMAASTNALTGYAITVNGTTLTSGTATIPAMSTAAQGTKGKSEFGMNLRANTVLTSTTPAGGDITPISDGGDLRAQALTGYELVDTFKFASGDVVADSGFNTPGPTNAQRYTATYIANVAGNQLAGSYTTTLTYVCTATY